MNQASGGGYQRRAAVILAGGEGSRLLSLTRSITGHDVPKQFCAVLGDGSLLEQTLGRVALAVEPTMTLVAVTREHEQFYSPILKGLPRRNLVVQPRNRGTAPAILYSLFRLAEREPRTSVAIFPSDHFVGDNVKFMRHVETAFAASVIRPELTVLLGIAPQWPETAYGWIEPGTAVANTPVLEVRRFWEKPRTDLAAQLLANGCLWNSFVLVGQLSALLGLFLIAMPQLYLSFKKIRPVLDTNFEEKTIDRLYTDLKAACFSEHVLSAHPVDLGVLPVDGVEWSDLGEPRRVMETIARTGIRPRWAAA